MKSDTADCID